jgi:sarcosine oxidase, subunit alpha
MVRITDGMEAFGQNAYPSVATDFGAVSGLFSAVLGAGFYYKTFIRPKGAWPYYEAMLRRAAGFGRAPDGPDPDRYEKVHLATEVLVVGSGPSGLAASLAAARAGAEVLLVEQSSFLGGCLASTFRQVGGVAGDAWLRSMLDEVRNLPNIQILTSAPVFGQYHGRLFGIAERCTAGSGIRERLWRVTAKRAIFATGAIERPLVFPDNDRPGIMLASAVSAYLYRYGVAAGRVGGIATNNDSAYALVDPLRASGIDIRAIVDLRSSVSAEAQHLAERAQVRLLAGSAIVGTRGRKALREIRIARISNGVPDLSRSDRVAVDHLAISGGWTPTVHLHSQGHGALSCAGHIGAFNPVNGSATITSVGAANGTFDILAGIEEGRLAGENRTRPTGEAARPPSPVRAENTEESAIVVFPRRLAGRCFVDLQNDVTAKDIWQAQKEGYAAAEHLKRYTTLGMGTDQGKTGNLNGAALLASALGAPVEAIGTTTYRPPYTPVTIGTLVGRDLGAFAHPMRQTAVHDWHESHGAVMMNAGQWRRPQYFPRPEESLREATIREISTVRSRTGLVDVSTLGRSIFKDPTRPIFWTAST